MTALLAVCRISRCSSRAEQIGVERGALDLVDLEDEVHRALRRVGRGGLRVEELPAEVREAAGALAATGQRDLVVAGVRVGDELAKVSPSTRTGVSPERLREKTYAMISFSASSRAMKLQSHAVRVLPFVLHALRGLVGEDDLLLGDELEQALETAASSSSAVRWKRSPSVESSTCTPARRYALAWRYSGSESAHFETTTCAMKVGPKRALS